MRWFIIMIFMIWQQIRSQERLLLEFNARSAAIKASVEMKKEKAKCQQK